MTRLLYRIVIIIIIMSSIETMAEEKDYPAGKSPRISLENKIKTSVDEAKLILLGSFKASVDSPALERLSDDESFMYVAFNIEKIYKGEISAKAIKLKIPIYTVPSKGSSRSAVDSEKKSIKLLTQDIRHLERKLEEGQIDKSKYVDELKNMRIQILHSPDYSSDKIVIVSIKRGGLDYKYRLVDVPIEFGKKYVLFVCKDISEQGATPLFSWELDLYSDEKLHLIENAL